MIRISVKFSFIVRLRYLNIISASDSASDSASTSQEIKPEDSRSTASNEAAPPRLKKVEGAATAQTVEGVTKDETGETI